MSEYNLLLFRSRGWCIACISLFLWLSPVFADSPATQPSVAGPRDIIKAFLLDFREGDAKDLPNYCIARQDDAQALLRSFQTVATAIGELRDAAAKKFGPDAVESILPDMSLPNDVDDMTETDAADHVELNGQPGDMQLVKSSTGDWKLDMDKLLHGSTLPSNPHYFTQFAQAVHRTTDDINSGRLDSAASAAEAFQAREQAIDEDAPATQPATQP